MYVASSLRYPFWRWCFYCKSIGLYSFTAVFYTHHNFFYTADGFKEDYGGHDEIFESNVVIVRAYDAQVWRSSCQWWVALPLAVLLRTFSELCKQQQQLHSRPFEPPDEQHLRRPGRSPPLGSVTYSRSVVTPSSPSAFLRAVGCRLGPGYASQRGRRLVQRARQ